MTFRIKFLILPAFFFLYSCDSGDGGAKDVTEEAAPEQFKLEQHYGQDDGMAKDATGGVKRYRKAAEQGDAEAQFKLGQIYFHGDGVAKDATEGVKWYRKAAEQGKPTAQYNLGVC